MCKTLVPTYTHNKERESTLREATQPDCVRFQRLDVPKASPGSDTYHSVFTTLYYDHRPCAFKIIIALGSACKLVQAEEPGSALEDSCAHGRVSCSMYSLGLSYPTSFLRCILPEPSLKRPSALSPMLVSKIFPPKPR